MKKIISITAVALAVASMVITSSAVTVTAEYNPYTQPYDVETGTLFPDTASTSTSPLTRSNYTLTAGVYGQNPLFSNPKAYGTGSTSITVYSVSARCNVNNNGSSTASTGWVTQNNTNLANSGTITASTATCSFNADAKSKETSSSIELSVSTNSINYP
jgi:hypothetical protein